MSLDADIRALYDKGVALSQEGTALGDGSILVSSWKYSGNLYRIELSGQKEEETQKDRTSDYVWASLKIIGPQTNGAIHYRNGAFTQENLQTQMIPGIYDTIEGMQRLSSLLKNTIDKRGAKVIGPSDQPFHEGILLEMTTATTMIELQRRLSQDKSGIVYSFASGHDYKHPGLNIGVNAIHAHKGPYSIWLIHASSLNNKAQTK